VDFELEKRVQMVCRTGIRQGWIKSAHDCAEGGLGVALCESSISSQLSITVKLPVHQSPLHTLFGESASRVIVSVSEEHIQTWEAYLQENLAGHWWSIGTVTDSYQPLKIQVNNICLSLNLGEISHIFHDTISAFWES
jgi:phosphoribosylformylglycinamidine synthase